MIDAVNADVHGLVARREAGNAEGARYPDTSDHEKPDKLYSGSVDSGEASGALLGANDSHVDRWEKAVAGLLRRGDVHGDRAVVSRCA